MSSEINPNVDVTSTNSETPAASTATAPSVGNNNINFDTLEAALASPPKSKASPKAPKAQAETPVVSEKDATAVKTLDTTPKEGDVTPKEGEKDAIVVKNEGEVEAAPAKSLKVKVGPRGKELELDLDMKLPVTVDGVDSEATLQDLRNDYSGRQAIAKRFSELDQRDKAYLADKEATESQISGILTKAYAKDPLGAILEMVKVAKLDPGPVFEGIREQLIGSDMRKFVDMSDEQRELHFKNLEVQFLRGYKESVDKEVSSKQADEALKTELSAMRETLKLSDDWVQQAEKEAETIEAYKAFKGDKKGILKLADGLRRWDLATKALTLVDADYAKNTSMIQFVVGQLEGQYTMTPEKAAEIVRKTLKLDSTAKAASEIKVPDSLTRKVSGAPQEVDASITPSDEDFDPAGWSRI